MRICVRAEDAKSVREILDRLEAAGVPAAAILGGPEASHASIECDLLISTPAQKASVARALEQDAGPLAALAAVPHATGPDAPAPFAAALPMDARPTVLKRILDDIWRDSVANRELEARMATLELAGIPLSAASQGGQDFSSVLFAGKPHQVFLDFSSAFAELGFGMEAALTISSAFDRLHESEIDALIINLEGAEEGGLALCGAIRRNSRLDGLPCCVVAATPSLTKAAFAKGALEAGPPESVAAISPAWIAAAARRRKHRRRLDGLLRQAGLPLRTDQQLFHAHVDRLSHMHHDQARPLSIVALALSAGATTPVSAEMWRLECRQAFDMVEGLIRASDLAVQSQPGEIAVILPCSRREHAQELADRAVKILESTGFIGLEAPLNLRSAACELAPGESGGGLLARCLSALT